jgi:hypothetical protein
MRRILNQERHVHFIHENLTDSDDSDENDRDDILIEEHNDRQWFED